jgi:hypothetical protein
MELTYLETEKQVKIKEDFLFLFFLGGEADPSACNLIACNEWILMFFNVGVG